jgi:hypothetical protein
MEAIGSNIRWRQGKTGSSAWRGPGPTAKAARGCPWAWPAGQGLSSGGAFGLVVDAGKK